MKIPQSDLQAKVFAAAKEHQEYSEQRQSDENYERMKVLVGSGVPVPRFLLTQEEKLGLFDSIIECLEAGNDNKTIAKNVISCLEDKLAEMDPYQKEEIINPTTGVKSPIFRRSGT